MLKGCQPLLMLLFGAGTGGLFVAIVLTDLFGIRLPAAFLPSQIDSGWGSLVGGLVTGLVAIGLFWMQRRVDQRDRWADTEKRDMVNISLAIRHLGDVEEFYSNEKVLKDLRGFVENKDHEYVASDGDEAMSIILTYEVYTVSFPKKIRKASSYLYLVSADRPLDSSMTDICHYYAIALDEIADSLDETFASILDDKANLIDGHNQARISLPCKRVQTAFFKLDRVVGCLRRLRQFA